MKYILFGFIQRKASSTTKGSITFTWDRHNMSKNWKIRGFLLVRKFESSANSVRVSHIYRHGFVKRTFLPTS